jgi:hypothetical protein
MGICLGLLHLVDGMGRMLGAAFALAVYGTMKGSPRQGYYWPVVASAFLGVCVVLHLVAFAVARKAPAALPKTACVEV